MVLNECVHRKIISEKKWTDAEMEAMRVPPNLRDYCAQYIITWHDCKAEEWPYTHRCRKEKKDWQHCQKEM